MTVGDPRGIGPEIVVKALADSRVRERCDVVVIGPDESGVQVGESVGRWRGKGGAELAGELSGLAIERAVQMATAGEVDGIVTAPIDKSALHAGGYDYPGHTEMLAHLTGSRVAMMLSMTITPGSGTSAREFGSRSILYCVPSSARSVTPGGLAGETLAP